MFEASAHRPTGRDRSHAVAPISALLLLGLLFLLIRPVAVHPATQCELEGGQREESVSDVHAVEPVGKPMLALSVGSIKRVASREVQNQSLRKRQFHARLPA